MTKRLLREFLIQLAFLLPVAYFVWYAFGPLFVWPVAQMSDLLSSVLLPDLVLQIRQEGVQLAVYTSKYAGGQPLASAAAAGQMVFKGLGFHVYAPPLGAGIPLFLALSVASGASFKRHMANLAIGLALLFLGQTVSVLFKVAAELLSELTLLHVQGGGVCGAECFRHLVFYGHYITYLVMPLLLPAVLWIVLYFPFLRRMVPSLGAIGALRE